MLLNMLDYLYYKLYQSVLKSSLWDIPEYIAPVYLGGVININILVIFAFLVKIDIGLFPFPDKVEAGVLCVTLIILMMFIYRKKRSEDVLKRYQQETNKQRIRGNIIVAAYVGISFLLIFAVAFFRPGKL